MTDKISIKRGHVGEPGQLSVAWAENALSVMASGVTVLTLSAGDKSEFPESVASLRGNILRLVLFHRAVCTAWVAEARLLVR